MRVRNLLNSVMRSDEENNVTKQLASRLASTPCCMLAGEN